MRGSTIDHLLLWQSFEDDSSWKPARILAEVVPALDRRIRCCVMPPCNPLSTTCGILETCPPLTPLSTPDDSCVATSSCACLDEFELSHNITLEAMIHAEELRSLAQSLTSNWGSAAETQEG